MSRAMVLLAALCILPGVARSYPWPFDHATSSQQVIRQTVGAYRHGTTENPNRLHAGVDIQPASGVSDTLYAISTAVVRWRVIGENDSWFWAGDAALQDGFGYVHVRIDTSVVKVDSLVTMGQAIGRVHPDFTHLHLNDGPASGPAVKNNPLLFLDSFVDTIPPIVDSLTFCRQGSGVVLVDTLRGKVDIAVAGRDSLGPEGTDEEPMPYGLGFRVYNHETDSLVLDKFSDPTIRFTQVASHSGYGQYIHRSVDASHPEYWITNTTIDGAQPANRFWNTRARAGDAWDADSSATRNEDARWPDGWYRVQVLLEDTEGNTNALGGPSGDTVFVGNFTPIVNRALVRQTRGARDSTVVYDARWEDGELVVDTDEPVRMVQGDTLLVELTFSESLHDTIRVTLEGPYSGLPFETVRWDTVVHPRDRWVGRYPLTTWDSIRNQMSGERRLVIWAEDAVTRNVLDTDPATAAYWDDEAEEWVGYEDDDGPRASPSRLRSGDELESEGDRGGSERSLREV